MECYRKMYAESIPKAKLSEIIATGEGKTEGWFSRYYLPQERVSEIINETCKRYKLESYEQKGMYTSAMLGSSPTSNFMGMLGERFPFMKRKEQPRKDFISNLYWAFGLELDSGWYQLIYDLCSEISSNLTEEQLEQFSVVQVKEKYAGLRFYY